jgi:hypothetical protein
MRIDYCREKTFGNATEGNHYCLKEVWEEYDEGKGYQNGQRVA